MIAAIGTLRQSDAVEYASRAYLAQVRALWVTAVTRAGLVGINQVVAASASTGPITIPIVASDGAEWAVPLWPAPASLDDDAWQQTAQSLYNLLATTQLHQKGPRVVVVCWGGVSAPVRQAMEAMGAEIEVPTLTVPLIELIEP